MTEVRHIDLRAQAPNPPPPRVRNGKTSNICKTVRGKVVERDPLDVRGITIHQTACVFGPMENREKAYQRAARVPAHATAFRDGTFVTPFPLRWLMYHGNALNDCSLGLECEGHYAGILDDPTTPTREDEESTWGGGPMALTPEATATFCAALKWLVEAGRAEGMPIQHIWAHRQSSASRRSDPGAAIWQVVVLDYAVRQLGLKTEPRLTWRDGLPIPREWDLGGKGRY